MELKSTEKVPNAWRVVSVENCQTHTQNKDEAQDNGSTALIQTSSGWITRQNSK